MILTRERRSGREEAMAGQGYVYAGAVSSMEGGKPGVFRQAIGNERWEALMDGLPGEAQVHAITVHPDDPNIVFVATTKGAYRSTDRGAQWRRLSLPDDNTDIWSITIHPKDRKTIYAGYGPVGVYRSDDGGERWAKPPQPGLPDRVHMTFPCRVMRLDVNPAQPDEVYACIEANGAMKSRDRGESWEDCTADLLRFAEQEKYKSRIVSQTEVEVGRYSPMTYGRDLRVSPHDPKVLYAALSPAFRSGDGAIYKSENVGKTWKRFDRGVKANNTMMGMAPHPRDPRQVYAVSKSGQVFGTRDGGDSWSETRLPQGTGDCYAVACG